MDLTTAYDVKTLASVLGCRTKDLVYYVYRRPQALQYKEFTITKKSGGERNICAPTSNLRLTQKSIATELAKLRTFSSCVNGFVKGRDIKRNAELHVGRKYVFNIDLQDFFGSITFPRIYGMLISKPYQLKPKVAACIAKACTYNDILPQGAPSSPIITNLICAKMDSQLTKLAKKYRCRYSRYADDITFSFNRNLPDAIVTCELDQDTGETAFVDAGHALAKIVEDNGFVINEKKVRLYSRGGRQEVTGLIVNEKTNVKRRYIRQIRAMLHAWRKHGYNDAQNEYWEKYESGGKEHNYQEVIRGKISFVRHIKGPSDPVFIKLAKVFNALTAGKKITLSLTPEEVSEQATWVTESDLEHGTAFLFEDIGFVTCAHCVGDNLIICHPSAPTKKYAIDVIKKNDDIDLAILSVPTELKDLIPLKRSSNNAAGKTIPIKLFGYPNHQTWLPVRKENGETVRSFPSSGVRYIEITAKIIEGNSGGPVFDESYDVLGVAVKGLNKGTDIKGAEFFAIDISELMQLEVSKNK